MGTVFVAADDILGREVAIKAIRPLALQLDGRARFLNEARAIAGLVHPNVVQVFDVGEQGDSPYLVMEMAAGGSLRARMERDGKMHASAVRALGIQIAHALAAAHARGIVHRDVKPANILEGESGVWKLADFGVAHVPDTHLTITGQFLGSPAYAAPESLLAGAFGPASDVYGLACTLFEATVGTGPHDHCGVETRLRSGDVERTMQTTALAAVCDRALADAIVRGLARDPAERPTGAQFAALLAARDRASVEPAPAASRRWLWVAVGAILLGVVAVIASAQQRGAGQPNASILNNANMPAESAEAPVVVQPVADPRFDDDRDEHEHEKRRKPRKGHGHRD